jgi:hypothetical protein
LGLDDVFFSVLFNVGDFGHCGIVSLAASGDASFKALSEFGKAFRRPPTASQAETGKNDGVRRG